MLERGALISVRRMLESAAEFPMTDCVFVPDGAIGLDTECLVDPADLYDPDFVPPLAVETKLRYVMMIEAVQSVLWNLDAQIATPSIEQKLEAFLFYRENDAFRDWG